MPLKGLPLGGSVQTRDFRTVHCLPVGDTEELVRHSDSGAGKESRKAGAGRALCRGPLFLRGGSRTDGGLGRPSPQGRLGSGREKLWKPETRRRGGPGAEGGRQGLTAGLRKGAGEGRPQGRGSEVTDPEGRQAQLLFLKHFQEKKREKTEEVVRVQDGDCFLAFLVEET